MGMEKWKQLIFGFFDTHFDSRLAGAIANSVRVKTPTLLIKMQIIACFYYGISELRYRYRYKSYF